MVDGIGWYNTILIGILINTISIPTYTNFGETGPCALSYTSTIFHIDNQTFAQCTVYMPAKINQITSSATAGAAFAIAGDQPQR
jgi:hypothetical protein